MKRSISSILMKRSKQNYFIMFFKNNLKSLKNTRKYIKGIFFIKRSSSNFSALLTYQNEKTANPERK